MKKLISIILFLCFFSGLISAQEKLIGLGGNPEIIKLHNKGDYHFSKSSRADTLSLPFFDDFAVLSVYPNQEKWSDFQAYINNQWALNPMSFGVASLDIADSTGKIRSLSTGGELSEYLTSRPIDLSYSPSDSIYLSFAYQAGGNLNAPEYQDSLVLEFTSPDTSWVRAWSTPGGFHDTAFNYVLIPVRDSFLLKKGFRFRFKNYGSTVSNSPEPSFNSNNDIWNLDYIWLDTARSINDTLIEDVAFTKNFSSIIKNYESVPWKHFTPVADTMMKDSLSFIYRNNGGSILQVDRQVFISDLWGNGADTSITNDNENIDPLTELNYTRPLPPPFYYYSDLTDSTHFLVEGILKTDTVSSRKKFRYNDTVRYYQKFENYYAYDDGIPESGFGIGGQGTSTAAVAYKFTPLKADTLRGFYIYFNRVLNDENQQYFYLSAWEDNEGVPGDTLVYQIGARPEFKDSLFQYTYYRLDTPVYVEDTFHAGWVKTTDDMLNIGFDMSRDASSKILYNIDGSWVQTSYKGALMMRPVFSEHDVTGINEFAEAKSSQVEVYPNPANDYFNIRTNQEPPGKYEIISISGRKVKTGEFCNRINVSELAEGMYILVFYRDNQVYDKKKLLINR